MINFRKIMDKMKKKWDKLTFHQKLLSVVEAYHEQEIKTTMDYLMRCPKCSRYHSLENHNGIWQCLWRDCCFQIWDSELQEIRDEILSKKIGLSIDKIKLIRKYL